MVQGAILSLIEGAAYQDENARLFGKLMQNMP